MYYWVNISVYKLNVAINNIEWCEIAMLFVLDSIDCEYMYFDGISYKKVEGRNRLF